MFSEKELFIGAMLWRLINNSAIHPITFKNLDGYSDILLVNQHPLYIKISKNRRSPWQFTFSTKNLATITELQEKFQKCYIALICGHDGTACLEENEISQIINLQSNRTESIRISRKQGEQYSANGSSGKLKGKISANSLSSKFS